MMSDPYSHSNQHEDHPKLYEGDASLCGEAYGVNWLFILFVTL